MSWNKIENSPFTVSNGKIDFNTDKLGKYALKEYKEPDTLILYNYGDMCTSASGGWQKFGIGPYTFESDHIRISWYWTSATKEWSGVCTANSIDLTPYKTLHVIAMEEGSGSNPNTVIGYATPDWHNLIDYSSSDRTKEKTADITNITDIGQLYFYGAYNYKQSGASRLYKMWLTKN